MVPFAHANVISDWWYPSFRRKKNDTIWLAVRYKEWYQIIEIANEYQTYRQNVCVILFYILKKNTNFYKAMHTDSKPYDCETTIKMLKNLAMPDENVCVPSGRMSRLNVENKQSIWLSADVHLQLYAI